MANTLNLGNGEWATKENSLLSYNDENGNYKPLPFDFTRASSATVVNKAGLIETVQSGIPRIDFLGNTNGALLLEPQRTNLFEYSESFSNSYWTKNGITESIGYLAPDGSTNAYKLIANAVDSSMYKVFSVTSGTTYSLSFYLKTVSGTLDTTIGLGSPGFPQNEGDGGRYKNITVTNEWKRYTLTSTADATASSGISFGGFGGFATGEEVLIYGAQLEAGSYPTSYIPTQGSTVTRVAETCSQTPPSGIIGQTEGTMFVEYDQNIIGLSATRRIMSLSDGTTSNRIVVYISGTNKIAFYVRNSSGQLFLGNSTSTNTIGNHKIAAAYKDGDYSVYLDGIEIISGVGTLGTIPTCNRIDLGNELGAGDLYEPIMQTLLYNTRLSNSELATLTSL